MPLASWPAAIGAVVASGAGVALAICWASQAAEEPAEAAAASEQQPAVSDQRAAGSGQPPAVTAQLAATPPLPVRAACSGRRRRGRGGAGRRPTGKRRLAGAEQGPVEEDWGLGRARMRLALGRVLRRAGGPVCWARLGQHVATAEIAAAVQPWLAGHATALAVAGYTLPKMWARVAANRKQKWLRDAGVDTCCSTRRPARWPKPAG
jgi:hypothetical protein